MKQADSNDTEVSWQRYKKEIKRQFRFFCTTDRQIRHDAQDMWDTKAVMIVRVMTSASCVISKQSTPHNPTQQPALENPHDSNKWS